MISFKCSKIVIESVDVNLDIFLPKRTWKVAKIGDMELEGFRVISVRLWHPQISTLVSHFENPHYPIEMTKYKKVPKFDK